MEEVENDIAKVDIIVLKGIWSYYSYVDIIYTAFEWGNDFSK